MKAELEGKVIVSCAPNGARRSKRDHSALPLTAAELAETAAEIRDAGACLLHLHVRDDAGAHSLDSDRYLTAMAAIKDRVGDDLIVQITTESCGRFDVGAQMDVVRTVRPEAASCALRELCPDDSVTGKYADFLAECRERGVWVQHILYDDDDARRFMQLRGKGVIGEDSPFVLLVIGRYSGESALASLPHLAARVAPLTADDSLVWGVCAFGLSEGPVTVAAAALGGHPRIGFENNLQRPDGVSAASNADQIRRFMGALPAIGRTAASSSQVRRAFGDKRDARVLIA